MVCRKIYSVLLISLLIIGVIGNLLFISPCEAAETTLYVDDSNTVGPWEGTIDYPYKTIHDAVTAANSNDIIIVFSGTYNEKISITKNLTIIGENIDTTFMDGGGSGHVINAYGTYNHELDITLKNLTIRNAGGSGFDCITFSYISSGQIVNNKILNSQEGEGISLDHCKGISIHDNIITNNKIKGISLTASEQNSIENNIIQDNQKGIQLDSYSLSNQVIGNSIRDNTQFGVYITQSSGNSFSQNEFIGNDQNAKDQSTNSWNVNNQGNYWDDYGHYDNNSDGIGDIPYLIPGGENEDEFPLGYFKQPEQPGEGNIMPVAVSISLSKTTAFYNETILFSGEGTDTDGYIVGYYWRSSLDGFLDSVQSFSSSSLSIGTHIIYFKVQDNDGAWSVEKTATLMIQSASNHAPVAVIDKITPSPAKQGEAVMFHGHGTDEEGSITQYKWLSSIDGVIGMESSFILSNLSRGTHTIYFQVKDNIEWSPQVTATLVIERNPADNPNNQPPLANIVSPNQGLVNESILFDGSQSYDAEGSITGYWTFGDNTSGTGLSKTHQYTAPGTYIVSLTVVDEDGESSSASISVNIVESYSQNSNSEGITLLDFEIPFPVLLLLVSLIVIGLFAGLILKIKHG